MTSSARSRRPAILLSILGFAVVLGVSILLASLGHSHATVVVEEPGGTKLRETGGFDMELFAVVLTGLGTTALAAATALLSVSTWRDVRASQEIAREAQETNRLANLDRELAPILTLEAPNEEVRKLSQVEARSVPFVRVLVRNDRGKRAAKGSRVVVPEYLSWQGNVQTLGSPSLGWMSAPEADANGELTIFGGIARAVDLGFFVPCILDGEHPDRITTALENIGSGFDLRAAQNGMSNSILWCLKLAFVGGFGIADQRDYLVPANVILRVIVGADDAEAREYDLALFWDGNSRTAADVLDSFQIQVHETPQF